ncbi:GyrI-like domain-containing protein [Cellulomonas fimi]|uniref:GyrI-like domain-containing protein n=1 Tax=Cellulomonas fimi TaxID=1708 RepID=UPI00234D6C3D|nr:GyrI-like domain-containing protein [Cellulomonas fimi]MDC7123432.1 GyrI-like domain-containing protein [Cellulomonas fimi]
MERRRAEPVVVERPAVPYVGIAARVTTATLPSVAERFDDLFTWVEAHSLTPAGPPFFRYRVVDMERELLVEAGLPLDEAVAEADGVVTPDVLPAGRYVVTTHVGHPDELVQVTADVLAWAEAHGEAWDRWPTEDGEAWGCRLELMLTDPRVEPDMSRWETQLAFRIVDSPGR